jgi:hypothetical protein
MVFLGIGSEVEADGKGGSGLDASTGNVEVTVADLSEGGQDGETVKTYSLPIEMGSPLAPRSPRPRIREPKDGE